MTKKVNLSKNKEFVLSFLNDFEERVKTISGIRLKIYKNSENKNSDNSFLSFENFLEQKKVFKSFYFSLEEFTFEGSLKNVEEIMKKYGDSFFYKLFLINKDGYSVASSRVVLSKNVNDFYHNITKELFLFGIKKQKNFRKLRIYRDPIIDNIKRRKKDIDSLDGEHDFYIDEDFSLGEYFKFFSFEEIRDKKALTKYYKILYRKFPLIFTGTKKDLYCSHIPFFNGFVSVFSVSFFGSYIKGDKKQKEFLENFYKENKKLIRDTSRYKNGDLKGVNIYQNDIVKLDIYTIKFLKFIDRFESDNFLDIIKRYVSFNFKLNNYFSSEDKALKVKEYLSKNDLDLSLSGLNSLENNSKNFLSFILKNRKINNNFYANEEFILKLKNILNRNLNEEDFNMIMNNGDSIRDIISLDKSLFKEIYKLMLRESHRINSHDLSYGFYSNTRCLNSDRVSNFVVNILRNEELSIEQLFSLLNILSSNSYEIDFSRNYSSFKEFTEFILKDSFDVFPLNKKEKKRLKKYKEQIIRSSIGLKDVYQKLFSGDKNEFLKITKKKGKFFNDSIKRTSRSFLLHDGELIEIKDYFKKLLGSKENLGEAIRPGKLFFEMNRRNQLSILDGEYKNVFEIKELLKKFSKREMDIKRITIKIENEDSIGFWCSGDFSNCCMGYGTSKLKGYITQRGFSLISIYLGEEIIGNAIIYQGYLGKDKVLVIDNVEMKNSHRKNKEIIREEFIEFLKEINEIYGYSGIYQGSFYNDLFLYEDDKPVDNTVKILGLEIDKKEKNNLRELIESRNGLRLNKGLGSLFQESIRELFYLDSRKYILRIF